ncbi:hypothetical protein C5167_016712 [Papaver somniferum]|uniref:uncharacterized protein LOC113345225 n=1 Tax=Papaver somniferum TaxID=3469 RepID=UPI000E6FBC90|nr:uncharacterized protein LOC113345225 [Papaver somniferum]RZC94017.1 hypothetical protein C5167_016712 [Papaver somniferum]
MKRESRQHGMVRSYMVLPSPLNPTPKSKIVNALESRPTAGAYTKVSRKPTNHSKFTGKCGVARCTDCQINPGSKSKDKAKGTQKLKSCRVAMNQQSLAWSVVDANNGNGFNYDSKSATGILAAISSGEYFDDYYYGDDDIDMMAMSH